MDLKQLHTFVEVVRYKSFTKAAEKTGMSQPSISAHIRALENEMNVKLIYRTTKTLDVTPFGQEFYEYACMVIGNRERMLHRWEEQEKSVRVGVSTIPSSYILPEVLPVFQRTNPGIVFDIHQTDGYSISEGILSGRYDVGLVGMEYSEPHIRCIPFYQDHMILITPATEYYQNMLLADSSLPVAEEIISGSPVILRDGGRIGHPKTDNIIRSLGINEDKLHVVARVNDQQAIMNLVRSGIGVSIVSEKAARPMVKERSVLSYSLPAEVAVRNLYVAVENREPGPADRNARLFASFVAQYYIGTPWEPIKE